MIYREVGQFKASYAADQAIFPIRRDRWLVLAALLAAYVVIPAWGSEYWLLTIMVPIQVIMVPEFLIVAKLDLTGTLWAVILPRAA